jgi:hypothetical protein
MSVLRLFSDGVGNGFSTGIPSIIIAVVLR